MRPTSPPAHFPHLYGQSGPTVACWGNNRNSQLGDNTTTNRSLPVAVSGLSGVPNITAGSYHTCA
ncbi:hypothetical protein [Candidatus Neomicrothrix sp.]|uniref:hypothetical protein n=1 Tax=Candidatus Neomicrothrix sp. TaxID=2719034 RepID=UPI003CD0C4FA